MLQMNLAFPQSQIEVRLKKMEDEANMNTVVDPNEIVDQPESEPEPDVVSNQVKFWFREPSKEDKAKGAVKRPDITLTLPYLTYPGFVKILNEADSKIIDYVLEIVNEEVRLAALEQVNDKNAPVNDQEHLDVSKLTLEYLANQIKEKKSSGISKEEWAEFKDDYITTMVEKTGVEKAKSEKAAAHFLNRLQMVKTSKPVLEKLVQLLDQWYDFKSVDEKVKYLPIYEFLHKKAAEFLENTDEKMLAALV